MIHNFQNTLAVGTVLQGNSYRYEIVKVLGQGSFGITYLASVKMVGDLGSVNAYVAIKEFFMSEINGRENTTVTTSQRDGVFDKYKRKFIKEAKSLGNLNHPNIVKVLESFEANKTVYYTMDFIEGGSLEQYISHKGRIPEKEALKLASEILSALSYMHSKHMLHLDLKPSNIMMSKGKPVLIDFGLSKQYDINGDPESSTTVGGGTLGYSPIEQINYNSDSDQIRALPVTMDLYALGATLFKMLTGKRPPIASDILNFGFPEDELAVQNISPKTIGLVKSLMMPLWKDRPQTDTQVLTEINKILTFEDESTVWDYKDVNKSNNSKETHISPKSNRPIENSDLKDIRSNYRDEVIEPIQTQGAKGSIKKYFIIAIALAVLVTAIVIFVNRQNEQIKVTDENNDFYAMSEPNVEEFDEEADSEPLDEPVYKPELSYSVLYHDDGIYDKNSQLCANIDGEEVVIGSINYIFGPDNMGCMQIFAQEDFDGDGIKDVLMYDINLGNAGGSTWTFITYAGNNTFDKSDLFSECSYYDYEISNVNGQYVLDFIKEDLGQKIVKERHGLKNGNVVSMDLPKSSTKAYSLIKTINMWDLGNDGHFFVDLNDDGTNEKISADGCTRWARFFYFYMEGKKYEFYVFGQTMEAQLNVLKSKTNGMHDLLVEDDSRYIFKWNGETYENEE